MLRGLDATSYGEVMSQAPEAVDRGLDLLGLTSRRRLVPIDADEMHAAWWRDSDGESVVRFWLSHTAKIEFRVSLSVIATPAIP